MVENKNPINGRKKKQIAKSSKLENSDSKNEYLPKSGYPPTWQPNSILEKIYFPIRDFIWSFKIEPAIKGITTYRQTDKSKVSQGMVMLVISNKKATIGAKANTIIMSFTETCTSV